MILVDTDVLIEIFDKDSKKGDGALKRLQTSGEDIIITSINLHEILYGLRKFGRHTRVEKILRLDVVDYGKEEAIEASKIELEMERKGKKVARTDAMIAACTLTNNVRLFTYNKRHFENIPGIELF